MKGEIKPDHIGVNKYTLLVAGLVELTCTEISGLEDELNTVELPDRTVASGGNRAASEFTIKIPLHHGVEQAAMELWFRESQDPVSPTYKKPVTLTHESGSGANDRSFTLVGVFPMKRKLPDLEMKNEGEMAEVEWTLSVDDIFPL